MRRPIAKVMPAVRDVPLVLAEEKLDMSTRKDGDLDGYPDVLESIQRPDGEYPELPEAVSEDVTRLAPSRATVLIVGGPGEVQFRVARALHERSPRAAASFVWIDCRLVVPDAVEAVLFGGPSYLPEGRGAVHEADAGTLYLASVHTLPLVVQPRFLGYLDARLTSRGRVVASTEMELVECVRATRFRRDLAERLDLVRIVL